MLDPLRIEQALANRFDNALRHGRGTIRLEASAEGRWLELRVVDQGVGFPPGFIEHAFERFTRVQGDSEDGAGLGLSIVDATATAHGGSAAAGNSAQGGACVTLRFPLAGEPMPPTPRNAPAQAA